MKKIIYLSAFFILNYYYGQDSIKDNTGLKNIAISSSPSQMLLDNAPSIIVAQPYVKAYNVSINNTDDISFDITPFLIDKKFKGWEYYGYYNNFENYNAFNNLLKATFSLSVKKETDYSNATIGFRTNIVTIYGTRKEKIKEKFKNFKESLNNAEENAKTRATKEVDEKYLAIIKTCDIHKPESDEQKKCINKVLAPRSIEIENLTMVYVNESKDVSKQDFYKIFNNPTLSLDVAAAYNHIFDDKEFSNNYQGRIGAWTTLKFSQPLNKNNDNFINGYLFSRYLKDNHYFNSDSQLFTTMNFVDYGARLQLEFKKFSLSYEFIKREGDLSDERSVGLITYKINENVYLNGGFGRNFEGINGNSFTLLGIAWGINSNNQSLDWNK